MDRIDLLVTLLLFSVAMFAAGGACALIEVWAQRRQADWRGENGTRGIR